MGLTPDDQVNLLGYLNSLHTSRKPRFALWKIEPDGSLVFINDGPTNGDFSREKQEAENQIKKSVFNKDLKTRLTSSLIGFAGKTRVVGVAIRDPLLISEVVSAVKLHPKKKSKSTAAKKLLQ